MQKGWKRSSREQLGVHAVCGIASIAVACFCDKPSDYRPLSLLSMKQFYDSEGIKIIW